MKKEKEIKTSTESKSQPSTRKRILVFIAALLAIAIVYVPIHFTKKGNARNTSSFQNDFSLVTPPPTGVTLESETIKSKDSNEENKSSVSTEDVEENEEKKNETSQTLQPQETYPSQSEIQNGVSLSSNHSYSIAPKQSNSSIWKNDAMDTGRCCIRDQTVFHSCTSLEQTNWETLKNLLENFSGQLVLCKFEVTKHYGDSPIYLRNQLEIQCIGRGSCIINGEGAFIYIVGDDAKVLIQGLTFRGASNTAVTVENSSINFHLICDCNFDENKRIHRGGAIKTSDDTRVIVESSRFFNNYGHWGGAIYNSGSEMVIAKSYFILNGAERGSAILSEGHSNITFFDNSFIDNHMGRTLVIESGSGFWKDEKNNFGRGNADSDCSTGFWLDFNTSVQTCLRFAARSLPVTSSLSPSPSLVNESMNPSLVSSKAIAKTFNEPSSAPLSLSSSSSSSSPTAEHLTLPLLFNSSSLSFPLRGAFYYTWYPQTWKVNGERVFYHPDLGHYRSGSVNVVDKHLESMDYAKIDVGILSWWGPGTVYEEQAIPLILNRTLVKDAKVKWAFYYEKEMTTNPSESKISNDLSYLRDKYGDNPSMAKIDGKPIMFVYNDGYAPDINGTCEVTKRWSIGNDKKEWYIVLKVFGKYFDCQHQPDGWHQYGPDTAQHVHSTSFVISPGFWRSDLDDPSLHRNITRWYSNIRNMVASNKDWQLIVSFNEWGEGTAIEGAQEWNSSSGYGQYLDALHSDGNH